MTVALSAGEIVDCLKDGFPESIEEAGKDSVLVRSDALTSVVEYLRTADGLKFDYLNYITSVDYYSYFEVVYMMTSIENNRSITIKARCTRDNPTMPSITASYQGADLQEREIFDLMGIRFEGHPDLKRLLLWEGFVGHPLRKDFNR